jgi:hypothetical protein
LDHFVAYLVTAAADITIDRPTGAGVAPVLVHLLPGDILVGVEDLAGPLGGISDRDYNDMMFQLRICDKTTPVPEPASGALLGLAGIAYLARRRRTA